MSENRLARSLEWMKRHPKTSILSGLVIGLGLIPGLVNLAVWIPIPTNGTNGDWISFWGSYLGGLFTLVAVILTIIVEKRHFDKAREDRKMEIRLEIENRKREIDLQNYDLYFKALNDAWTYFDEMFEQVSTLDSMWFIRALTGHLSLLQKYKARMKSKVMIEVLTASISAMATCNNAFIPGLNYDETSKRQALAQLRSELEHAIDTLNSLAPIDVSQIGGIDE